MQRLKERLDQELYDSDEQEGELLNESIASVVGFEVSDGEEETDTFDDMFVATATAAGYRGKLGLIKYREAEAARELELACALNSLTPPQLLAIFRVSGNSCESWHAACAHRECKKCSPMTQLRLQVSHSEWRLPRAELCEHRTTVGLARAIVSHEEHCPGCAESRHVTIAERLQASSAVPSLSQPCTDTARSAGAALCCVTVPHRKSCRRQPRLVASLMPIAHSAH